MEYTQHKVTCKLVNDSFNCLKSFYISLATKTNLLLFIIIIYYYYYYK